MIVEMSQRSVYAQVEMVKLVWLATMSSWLVRLCR
jgi:hypothetical protein